MAININPSEVDEFATKAAAKVLRPFIRSRFSWVQLMGAPWGTKRPENLLESIIRPLTPRQSRGTSAEQLFYQRNLMAALDPEGQQDVVFCAPEIIPPTITTAGIGALREYRATLRDSNLLKPLKTIVVVRIGQDYYQRRDGVEYYEMYPNAYNPTQMTTSLGLYNDVNAMDVGMVFAVEYNSRGQKARGSEIAFFGSRRLWFGKWVY